MSSTKAILITGATGKQGGSVVDALLNAGALQDYRLLAVTRNPQSEAAKKLQAREVTIIRGDLNDIPGVFSSAKEQLGEGGQVWGVYSLQTSQGKGASAASEEKQGKALIDASISEGVSFFVYSSVDRGGEARSWENPTNVEHWICKHNIEKHLVKATTTDRVSMRWTILRPTAFMENMGVDGFITKVTAASYRAAVKDKPFQLVSIKDIGVFAAKAFLDTEKYAGRSISVAGDQLTHAQMRNVFKEKVGREFPESSGLVARGVLWMASDLGRMFRWFYDEGFGADIEALRAEHPDLLSFGDWLVKESSWANSRV